MPGLLGTVQASGERNASVIFDAIRAPIAENHRLAWEQTVDACGAWAIGRAHLGFVQPAAQLAGDRQVHVLLHGNLHNARDLSRELGLTTAHDAEVVAAAYERWGRAFVTKLAGAFCLAVLDRAAGVLLVASDRVGSYPIYWARVGDRLTFGPSVRAVLRDPDMRARLDRRAAADLLHFGFVCGDRTLADRVQLLGPGTALTFEWRRGIVALDTYFHPTGFFEPQSPTRQAYEDRTCSAFVAAVTRATDGSDRLGLSLSGGLDSRAVLSAVNGKSSLMTAYTVGVDGCADEVLARRLASLTGARFRFGALEPGDADAFLPVLNRIASMTDGMYLTHGLTEVVALALIESDRPHVLLRGHGGELAKSSLAWPFHTDARVKQLTATGQLVDYLASRARVVDSGTAPADLFTLVEMREGPRASLAERLRGVDLRPADLCSYVYLWEHHRRFTVASLEMFRSVAEVRLPFVDDEFLAALLGGDAEWRETTALHTAIMRRFAPALLRVRNSNTGAPADAGPLQEAIYDKLNSVLRRLNVRGYRHYHSFHAWMHSAFLPAAERVLLAPDARVHEITNPHALRRLVDDTRSGAANHAYLLQALLILELWLRENL